jgi:hypothetical protein
MKRTRRWAQPSSPSRRPTSHLLHVERLEDRLLLSVDVFEGIAGLNWRVAGGCQPPNPTGAVGTTHYLEGAGDSLGIYDRSTGDFQVLPLSRVFQDLPRASFFCDTHIIYDDGSQRFIVAAQGGDPNELLHHWLYVAASDTNNPADGFTEVHRLDLDEHQGTNVYHAESLSLGFTGEAVVAAMRMGRDLGGGRTIYDHTQVVALGLDSLLDYDSNTLDEFPLDVHSPFGMAAAVMHDAGPGASAWLIGFDQPTATLKVLRIDQILSTSPTVETFSLDVPPFQYAPNAPEPGGTIQVNKFLMESAAWRNDRLVASHSVGSAGVARARWYEIETSGGVAQLVQVGEINPGPDIYTYHPTVEIGANEEIGMAYTQSSADQYLSMYATGRYPDEPIGTMQEPVLVSEGKATISSLGAGFYGGISVDPLTSSFWAANASAPESIGWYSWISHFDVTPDTGPHGMIQDSANRQQRPPAELSFPVRRDRTEVCLPLEPPAADDIFWTPSGDFLLAWFGAADKDRDGEALFAHGDPSSTRGNLSDLMGVLPVADLFSPQQNP